MVVRVGNIEVDFNPAQYPGMVSIRTFDGIIEDTKIKVGYPGGYIIINPKEFKIISAVFSEKNNG